MFHWMPAPTTLRIAFLLCFGCFAEPILGMAMGEMVIYEGRLRVEGRPFDGVGRFKFALMDSTGAPVWSSQPMNLHVNDGAYAVRLGDSAQAPPIAEGLLRGTALPKLRIWFERPAHGWSVTGPDVTLTSERAAEGSDTGSQMAAVLTELREIRALIEGKPASTPAPAAETVTVSIHGAPATGSAEAPLVLVEFTDFQCPYSIAFEKTMAALKTKYVDPGKLRIFTRNVPQPFHSLAVPAARAALCAEQQGRFWPMRERLFAANGSLSDDALRKAAAEAGLDAGKFQECLASAEVAAAVERDRKDALAAGIVATPTLVLGRLAGDKVTGIKLVGGHPLLRIEMEMRRLLQQETAK